MRPSVRLSAIMTSTGSALMTAICRGSMPFSANQMPAPDHRGAERHHREEVAERDPALGARLRTGSGRWWPCVSPRAPTGGSCRGDDVGGVAEGERHDREHRVEAAVGRVQRGVADPEVVVAPDLAEGVGDRIPTDRCPCGRCRPDAARPRARAAAACRPRFRSAPAACSQSIARSCMKRMVRTVSGWTKPESRATGRPKRSGPRVEGDAGSPGEGISCTGPMSWITGGSFGA